MVILVRRSVHRSPERLQQEMEEVFRALVPARSRGALPTQAVWRPPLEVYETEESLVILAEIAGLTEDGFSIVADAGTVSIRGSRPDHRLGELRRYREVGIAYGDFAADVYLPFPVNIDAATAEYEHGLLRIELPRLSARTIIPRRAGTPGQDEG
jgi:HSP20 family protein